jgi:adhesin HecA-like repeat protein
MAVYSNIESIKRLSNSSLTSIIDVTNLNFKNLANANLEFLNNIKYDEVANSFDVYSGKFEIAEFTNKLILTESGITTFTINSAGKATGKDLLVDVSETKRQRFTDFPDYPAIGVPGEIVYTGVQGLDPVFGEDFIGFLASRGWVSLTKDNGGGGGGSVNLDDSGHRKIIRANQLLTIQPDYQYWIYGDFTVEGVVNNSGELVIANGTLRISGSGQVNNYGNGLVKIVNLATGDSTRVVVLSFTAIANTPIVLTHGLNTKDFVYSVREGNEPIDVNIEHLNNNSIEVTSTADITDGRIVFQAKI